MAEELEIGDAIRITIGRLASFYGRVIAVDNELNRVRAVGKFLDQRDSVEHFVSIGVSGVERLGGEFRNRAVLVVASRNKIQNLVQAALENSDCQVIGVPNIDAAMLVCEYYQAPIDLMIMDVEMPEMSGRDLANQLVRLRANFNVLFTSEYTEDVLLYQGVLDDECHFLPMPFTAENLVRKVKEILHGSRGDS